MQGRHKASGLTSAIRSTLRSTSSDPFNRGFSAAWRIGAAGVASMLIGLAPAAAWSAPIVYDINLDETNVDISGTITTDGTLGVLHQANVTGFDLDVTFVVNAGPATATAHVTGTTPICESAGCGLTATATDLFLGTSPVGRIQFINGTEQLVLAGFVFGGQILATESTGAVGSQKQGTQIFGGDSVPVLITGHPSVPEPGSVALVGLALGGLAAVRRRR